MDARLVRGIEQGVELSASAVLAGAVGFAAYDFLSPGVAHGELLVLATLAAALCLLGCLKAFARASFLALPFRLPAFTLQSLEPVDLDDQIAEPEQAVDELILTKADEVDCDETDTEEGPLLLEDVLEEIGPQSRVVRLFDRKAMPTPGQMQSRIEHHLSRRPNGLPDASQALSDALAELRRSLR